MIRLKKGKLHDIFRFNKKANKIMKLRNIYLSIILLFGFLMITALPMLSPQNSELNIESPEASLSVDWVSPWNQYQYEYGRGMCIDEDSGDLYIVGYNGSTTDSDIILIKYDSSGTYLWNITWDNGENELGYDISLDSQKNIYIAGANGTTFPNWDGILLKFNSTGDLVWKKSYNGGSSDGFWGIHIDSNDDIFVVCSSITTSYDSIVFKYNTTGDLQWMSIFGGPSYQTCYDITLDSIGNIYIAGLNRSSHSDDYLVVKLDHSGNHLWNRTWGGLQSDQAFAAGVDASDNIYIAGSSNSFGSVNKDITLVKFDTNGNKLWNRTWDSSWSEETWSIAFDSAGYVYVGGYQVNGDVFILKYDSAGSLILVEMWDRGVMYSNWCYDLIIDKNDILYFTGHTLLTNEFDIITVKYSIESPGAFTLWSDADDPDDDGNFTLFWDVSPRANNYSIFYSNTSANIDIESETPWIENILNNDIDVSFGNGTYYFLVVAYNEYGHAVSNYELATVQIEPTGDNGEPTPWIPGYSTLVISLIIIGITMIIIRRKKKFLK